MSSYRAGAAWAGKDPAATAGSLVTTRGFVTSALRHQAGPASQPGLLRSQVPVVAARSGGVLGEDVEVDELGRPVERLHQALADLGQALLAAWIRFTGARRLLALERRDHVDDVGVLLGPRGHLADEPGAGLLDLHELVHQPHEGGLLA